MNFQRDELWRILTDKGWEIEITDNYDYQRWSKEAWRLRSLWSQVGSTVFISFLLDPMEIRPEKEFVWAVAIYSEPPIYGIRNKFTMPLNHWKDNLPQFLEALEGLRRVQ